MFAYRLNLHLVFFFICHFAMMSLKKITLCIYFQDGIMSEGDCIMSKEDVSIDFILYEYVIFLVAHMPYSFSSSPRTLISPNSVMSVSIIMEVISTLVTGLYLQRSSTRIGPHLH